MKSKTNECHNKCYAGCHGDDISGQGGGCFYPKTGKNAHQNFSFKGAKIFLYRYNDHKTIFARKAKKKKKNPVLQAGGPSK